MKTSSKFIALTGGVGGAKLAQGLAAVLTPAQLLIVANTGDDFSHLGLNISPDLDSVMYALAGLNDQVRGWGIRDESWAFMAQMERLGGDTWFQLGDRDLATHVLRTQLISSGKSLTAATASLCTGLGIQHRLVPMSDDPVATIVQTAEGELSFQEYFVARQCEPAVTGFYFSGVDASCAQADFSRWLADPELTAILICPSNPFVSVAPILGVPSVRDAIAASGKPVLAVSPLIAGQAIKGPAAKMMDELQMPRDSLGVTQYLREQLPGANLHMVIDAADTGLAPAIEALGVPTLSTETWMRSDDDKSRLAQTVLQLTDA